MVLVAGVIGCAVPQGAAQQGGRVATVDERIASLSPAERDELQRSTDMPSGYDPETRAARDAFFAWAAGRDARDPQQPAMEIPRMEDLPPHEWATYGYTPPAAQQPAMEIPRMEDLPPHEWATYGYTPLADDHDR